MNQCTAIKKEDLTRPNFHWLDFFRSNTSDIRSPSFGSPEDIMKKLHSAGVEVDQCFCEGSWLHISKRKLGKNRMMYGYYLYDDKLKKRVFKPI